MSLYEPEGIDHSGSAAVEARVDDLIDRMSLEEKVAQLGSINARELLNGEELDRGGGRSTPIWPTASAI